MVSKKNKGHSYNVEVWCVQELVWELTYLDK